MRAVVITVSGLQPAYLGCYGNEWVPTPTIDQWAATGVVFDAHFGDCPEPAAARKAWRRTNEQGDLITELRAAGVRTVYIGPKPANDESSGTGWDAEFRIERDSGPITLKATRRALRKVNDKIDDASQALIWIDIDALLPPWIIDHDDLEQFFDAELADELEPDDEAAAAPGLEPWEGHLPKNIGADDDMSFQRLQRTYAAAVASLDDALGQLWKDLAKAGWADDTLLCLTSDTGFPLGEHGDVGRESINLQEESVHLPLLLRWPDEANAGLRVREFTQPPDLGAALRGLFALSPQASLQSAPPGLLALAAGSTQAIRTHAVVVAPAGLDARWAVRTHEWYLLATDGAEPTRRLYVKPDDRWEFNDVAQHHPDIVAELEQVFREQLQINRAAN